MTSVTVTVEKDKKPQYKEYVNFLDNYRSGKRNDCDSASSSSSIVSDVSDANEMPTKSFKEYLQDYNNKKYQPVQPTFIKKNDEVKNVKTEVFIQINNESENDRNQIKITLPKPKVDDVDGDQIQVSTGNSNKIKRSSSITEKTKLFEEKSEDSFKINKRNFIEKFPKNGVAVPKKINGHRQNQTFIEIRKQELQNNPRLKGSVSPPQLQSNNISSEIIQEKTIVIKPISNNEEKTDILPKENIIKLELNNPNSAIPSPPPPPPLPPVNLPPKPISSNPKTTSSLKPSNVQSKTIQKIPNGYSTLPKMPNNKNEAVENSSIDKNDPRVKKLVYGALRGMYGAYHDKANDYLATLPKNRVKKGNGLDSIINSIAQPSQFVGTGQRIGPSPQSFIIGHIPPVRLKNQVIEKTMDPPACVQNAMMTKDKKPFTYTPGGIDLSEARSPRLQRRIERNAHLQGVGDLPQHPAPHSQVTGPLPPSTLAAMRPQPQVQVFPSGPPPSVPLRGSIPPPPPPPQKGIPPPPPPPNCPLPTQKVQTSDNQVLERPDMTKIIPENPMSLLRRTGGPQPRKSLVDQLFEEVGKPTTECRSPPAQTQQQFQPAQQRIQPVGVPISPVPQTYKPQQQPLVEQQQYQPPVKQNIPVREKYSEPVIEQPRYQPPVIDRQPISPQSNGKQDVKTSTANLGSLYIPPINQQQQKRIVSPPTPPERNVDSPSLQTPPLREAPRPWQTKKAQEEVPSWAKKDNQVPNNVEGNRKVSPPVAQPQQRWPQAQVNEQPSYNQQQQYEQPKYNQQFTQPSYGKQDVNQNQQPIGIRIDIRTNPQASYQPQPEVENNSNVVYVTQPLVLQHPGGGSQKQPSNQGPTYQGGIRVVPADGSSKGGNERVLNRQQSWGNNPTQSNSFKVLQKFTNTDDDDFVNVPITEHSPKYTQNYQQPVDQMRRMKINDGEQHITNTFKQVSRGPQSPQPKGPQIRNIPIQIEGEDSPRPYVHPSEQVVPEPKKYTGSSIPSRSFKILQAMTAPNDYANVEEQNEDIPYDEWVYPPYYPPYPYPPYWYDYHRYYYPDSSPEDNRTNKKSPRSSTSRSTSPATPGRHTPLPFWGYGPPYYPPSKSSDSLKDTPKSIPPPWYCYDQYYPSEQEGDTTDESSAECFPYYDPYYYHYYYGYPPMYPPYPPRYSTSETDSTMNGYSSLDENQDKSPQKPTTNKPTPTICINEIVTFNKDAEDTIETTTDCETDTETDDEYSNDVKANPLQSMKSITNMDVLNADSSDEETSKVEIEELSEGSNEDDASSMYYEEDAYPHQLSVIMEESERAESRLRTVSALSDSMTLAERSDAEEDIEEDNKNIVIEEDNKNIVNEEDNKNIVNEEDNKNIVIEQSEVVDEVNDDGNNSDGSEDWWGIIGKEDDDLPKPRNLTYRSYVEEDINNDNAVSETETIIEDDTILETKNNINTEVEIDKNESNNESTEFLVVRREKSKDSSADIKPRPKSIYDSLEDIKTESTGSLVKVDNFVGLLEQIKKESGFWDLNSQEDTQPVKFRRTKSVEEKSNEDLEKRFTWTSFENFNKETCNICSDDNEIDEKTKRLSCGALEDNEIVKSSTNYIKYNSSVSSKPNFDQKIENNSNESDTEETESSSSEKETSHLVQLSDDTNVKIPTIKDRIQALRDSINSKRKYLDTKSPSKENVSRSKTASSKSSVKSSEEYSEEEEEVDSGVTSDMSRHISDTEEFPELRKLTKYQRAATHSRLFKLLQEECNNEDANEPDEEKPNLSLQLTDISNNSQINERLVNELIDSLLRLKKGQAFKNLPKEKLYAAAVKILQEDKEIAETPLEEYNSLLSPMRSSTGYSTAVNTPQEFCNSFEDYKQYYESWERDEESYEVFPSKAFKALQEMSNKQGGGGLGSLIKCPKVLSSKNIYRKLIKLLESSENSSNPIPDKPPLDTNEVTSAS